jgi:chromosome segregation ATPase
MDLKAHLQEILMGRTGSLFVALLCVGALSLVTDAAYAQSARSGGGASAQLMQQMQQLASERTSLQAENTKLKKDLEDLRKDRDALKNAQQAVDRRAKSSEIALNSLKESLAQHTSTTDRELAQTKEKMQQLVAKFRETLQKLQEVETEGTTARQTLATRDQDLKVCVDRNLALYKLNEEVLTRLEHQSVWTRVAQSEPFTRIKRNQLENLVDDYKDRADEQRIDPSHAAGLSNTVPRAPSSPPPPPPPAAPAPQH